MFGGLEIKAKKPEQAPAPQPAPAAASSGFSFMNTTAAPAPAPENPPAPAAASSGFSFLNAAPEATETPAPAPTAPAVSGFSFLQESASATTAEDSVKPESTQATANTDPPAAADAVGSAFSFLATTSEPAPAPLEAKTEGTVPDPSDGTNAAASSAASGFSFLSSPAPTEEVTPEPAAPAITTPSNPISLSFAPAAPVAPAGAGISFGGASASAARPKKKKSRAVKVGVGASSAPPTLPGQLGSSGLPAPSELPKPDEKAPPEPASNTREDALDAARRAEEFMIQKMAEHSQAEREAAKAAEEQKTASAPKTDGKYEDEMIAAAAAAAVEAQAMQKSSGGALGIMGGLFRRSSPPTSSSNLTATTGGSKPGSFSNASGSRPPKPSNIETVVTKPSSGNSLKSEDSVPAVASGPVASTPAPAPAPLPVQQSSAPALSFAPALPPKPAPKPQPPKPQTPEEKLNALLLNFRRDVEASMSKVTQMRQQRSKLVEEKSRAMTQERLATQQRDLTEEQLTAAAEAEDFELADKLGSVLTSYEDEQKECARMLEHIDTAITELDSQKQSVVDGVQKCFQNIRTQLQTFEASEESKEHASDDSFGKKFATMTKHLAQEHERLENDLKHLERDEELVAEERNEVETAISEQSCEFEKQRDEAKEKLSAIDEEIEELRKQLEAKQAVATELRNDIAGHEDSILQVRVQFSRQLKRVQKKESTIQDHRKEWEAEKAKFQTEKDDHEAEVKAHSDAVEAHEKLMASLKQEIALASILEEIVQKEVGEADTNVDGDESDDGGLLSLQADVVKSEAAVSEAKEALKVATTTLADLEAEMGTLIAKIPELEAIKKAAAAKRDFKAAGKASKEIKDATARVKECQEELTGEAVEKKDAAEKELERLEGELDDKRKVALEKEKETGIVTMKKLAERIEQLVEKKKEICGEESDPHKVQGIGAFVLEEQIKSLALEGQAYGEKFGGWEDLVAGLLNSGSTSEKEEVEVKADTSSKEAKEPSGDNDKTADAVKAPEPSKPTMSKAAMKDSFRKLTQELEEIERKIEAAVEEEDFDAAAEHQETLQRLMSEVGELDLTDAEMEEALSGDDVADSTEPPSDTIAPSNSAAESIEASTDDVVEDAAGDDKVTEEEPMEEEAAPSENADEKNDSVTVEQENEELQQPKSITSEDMDEKKSAALSEDEQSQPTADDNEEIANTISKDSAGTEEDVDEKKDGDANVDDGFVAVDDDDL